MADLTRRCLPLTPLDELAAWTRRSGVRWPRLCGGVETFSEVPDGRDTALTLRLQANMLVRHNGGTTASEPTSTTRIVYTRLSTVAQTLDQ